MIQYNLFYSTTPLVSERIDVFLMAAVTAATFFIAVFWTFMAKSRDSDFVVGRILKSLVMATLATPAAFFALGICCSAIAAPTTAVALQTGLQRQAPMIICCAGVLLIILISGIAVYYVGRQVGR